MLYIIALDTYYSLLLFLLSFNLKELDKCVFVFGRNIEHNKYLDHNSFKTYYLNDVYLKKGTIINIYNEYRFVKKILNNINFKDNNYEVYGHDHLYYSMFLLKSLKKIFLLEDGIGNYNSGNFFPKTLKRKILLKLLNLRGMYGVDERVKKIFLTGISSIPKEITSKSEVIDVENLWLRKSQSDKELISKIFFNKKIVGFNKYKNKVIFLTQPLSEDGFLTLEEEIELYRKIFNNYGIENIVLKNHPREKKDYNLFFPEIDILEKTVPIEMFKLLNIEFKRIASILSTGVFIFKDKYDFYGTVVHPKLYNKLGTITNETLTNKGKT